MRWLNRVAAALAWSIGGMSILLLLILAGCVGGGRWKRPPELVDFFENAAMFGAGLVWPLCALVAVAVLTLLAMMMARRETRTLWRGTALMLGVAALGGAWGMGIRPPASRTGVFTGKLSYGHTGVRPDLFFPCPDSTGPLSWGADLARASEGDVPVMFGVPLPEDGWAGSHPRDWPRTGSDIHGVQYWQVRVRGRLTGPGQYGWPPVISYRLRVDSVLSVAPSRVFEDECVGDRPPG